MANLVFNIAKGRVVELFTRVDNNDPTNSAIIVVPVDAGATGDATIIDYDTLSAALAGLTERTTGGWNRKTLTDTNITVSATPDDTANTYSVTIPDQTWTAVSAGAVTDLLICYDGDTTAGTDANIVPLLCLDFAITPDGSDVTASTSGGTTNIFTAS
jgi:hypothetical protein